MPVSRKAINFDLSVEQLKQHYSKPVPYAYAEIREFMENWKAKHVQGSMYILPRMSFWDYEKINKKLFKQHPWLEQSMKSGLVSNIYNQYDLKQSSPQIPAQDIKSNRLIHFDIDTKEATAYYKSQGYRSDYHILHNRINSFMEKEGMEHMQGSVYGISKMTQAEFNRFTDKIFRAIPELYDLSREISVSKTGSQRDILETFHNSIQYDIEKELSLSKTHDKSNVDVNYSHNGKSYKLTIGKIEPNNFTLQEKQGNQWKTLNYADLLFEDEAHAKHVNDIINRVRCPQNHTKQLSQER